MASARSAWIGWMGWHEYSYVSTWSIMHFLSGYAWNIVWVFAWDDYMPWLNLWILMAIALFFELLENQPRSGAWMWGCLGYDETTYDGDSAVNAISDVLFTLAGWGVVKLVASFTTSDIALGALLGTGGVMFLVFLALFREERRIQLGSPAMAATTTALAQAAARQPALWLLDPQDARVRSAR